MWRHDFSQPLHPAASPHPRPPSCLPGSIHPAPHSGALPRHSPFLLHPPQTLLFPTLIQGLHRVTLCAALNTGQAVAESCLSAAVLLGGVRFLGAGALVSMGWASLLTQAAQLVACLTAVHAALPHQHGSLRGAWAGETGPRQPLLEEEAGEDEPALRPPCADFLPASTAPLLVSDAGGSGTLPPDAAADGTDAHASAPSPANHQQPPTAPASASRAFLDDGVNMLLRSITLQATFFAALVAASRLGTAALAAHSVVAQLWMLSAYAVDGFAAAGIVLGSRLAGAADDSDQGGDAALKWVAGELGGAGCCPLRMCSGLRVWWVQTE